MRRAAFGMVGPIMAIALAGCSTAITAPTGTPYLSGCEAAGDCGQTPTPWVPCGSDCGNTLPSGVTAAATPWPTPTPPPPPSVAYSCTGSAPAGVRITYGGEGSNFSASRLPFRHSDPYDPTPLYYSVSAQLQGRGSVTCTVTVDSDNGPVGTKTASASGGYNIAMAEVCRDFQGAWSAC